MNKATCKIEGCDCINTGALCFGVGRDQAQARNIRKCNSDDTSRLQNELKKANAQLAELKELYLDETLTDYSKVIVLGMIVNPPEITDEQMQEMVRHCEELGYLSENKIDRREK